MRKIKGSITVFLSLILLSILALICVCLESARASGIQASVQMCADSVMQSVLAGYDRMLWEEYGLFFFADSDRQGTRLSHLAENYAEKNRDSAGAGMNWFAWKENSVMAEHLTYATDCHGNIFRQAVSDYMKIVGAAESAGELLRKLALTDSAGGLTETGKKWEEICQEEETDIKDLLEEYKDLQEEQAKTEAQSPAGSDNMDGTGMSREEAEPVVNSVMETIERIGRFGLLGFVAEDAAGLGNEVISGEELPSSLKSSGREGDGRGSRQAEAMDYPLFYEYVIRNLDCYTSEERKNCAVEYVIAGKNTERKNVSSVAARLFAIRYLLNQSAVLTEPQLQAEAEMLAAAALGWTGIAPLVEGLKHILLLALAIGESALDVRALFSGERVPLVKNASNWKLRLLHLPEALGSFSEKKSGEENADHNTEGISYEEYLRVLLLLNHQEDIVYRTMDMIQIDLNRTEPGFRFCNCIYYGEITLTAEADGIFPLVPAFSGYSFAGKAGGGYTQAQK